MLGQEIIFISPSNFRPTPRSGHDESAVIVEAHGEERAGKYIGRKRPVPVRNRHASTRDPPLIRARPFMPLSEDGATVDRCITALSFRFPGEACQWTGRWFGNRRNFAFAKSRAQAVDWLRRERQAFAAPTRRRT